MHRFVKLSVLVLMGLVLSCGKSPPESSTQSVEYDSTKTTGSEPQEVVEISLNDLVKSPEKLRFYGDGAGDSVEVQRILENGGFFRKELTTKDGRYLLQLGIFDGRSGPENIAVLSKESGGKFAPTVVVPIMVKSVPSFYEKNDTLMINFKQETDWGAEVEIVDDNLKFKGFEE